MKSTSGDFCEATHQLKKTVPFRRIRGLFFLAAAIAGPALTASIGLGQGEPGVPPSASGARESDYIAKDFHFKDGEVLPELRIHYRVLGQPHRNASGHVDNAVLLMHMTGANGTVFLAPPFAGVMFKPGGLLDALEVLSDFARCDWPRQVFQTERWLACSLS